LNSYVLFNSSALWIGDNKELPSWIAEVVGSNNPNLSIFYQSGKIQHRVEFGLGECRITWLGKPGSFTCPHAFSYNNLFPIHGRNLSLDNAIAGDHVEPEVFQ
jgi:hypothetical protein